MTTHNNRQENGDQEPEEEAHLDDVLFDDDGQEEAVQDKVKRLREKLKRSEKEREENLTGWQRAKADFVNLKKREAEAQERAFERAVEEIVSQMFPLLDSFKGAFTSESWERADEEFKNGIESIYQQFLTSLKNLGVEEVGYEGERFDPHVHTSVSTRETDDETKDDTIARVLQKGYKFNDRIIRSPKVEVFHYKK